MRQLTTLHPSEETEKWLSTLSSLVLFHLVLSPSLWNDAAHCVVPSQLL